MKTKKPSLSLDLLVQCRKFRVQRVIVENAANAESADNKALKVNPVFQIFLVLKVPKASKVQLAPKGNVVNRVLKVCAVNKDSKGHREFKALVYHVRPLSLLSRI